MIIRAIPQLRTDDNLTTDAATIVREWAIETDGTDHSVYDVIAEFPQFTPGALTVDGLVVGNVNLKNRGTSDWLTLEVEYSNAEFDSPLQKPIDWTWDSARVEVPAWVDAKGRPLVTTAGEIIPGLTRKIRIWNVRGTRNVPGVPSWILAGYGDSVNGDSVRLDGINFQPNYLALEKLSIGTWQEYKVQGRAVRFREMSFEFWYNPLSWSTFALNRGFVELLTREEVLETDSDGNPTKKRKVPYQIRATNNAGEEVNSPVFLDKNGKRPRDKTTGLIKEQLAPADIVVLRFDLQNALPYAPLLR